LIAVAAGLVDHGGWLPVLAQVGSQSLDGRFLLTRGRVGQHEVGMTVNAAYKRIGPQHIRLASAFAEDTLRRF
jgi:hypothetical protein